MTDPRTLPNDRFGYSVYSLVALASPEQVRMVAEARQMIGQERAMVPAHVTIRGTFYQIESLEAMRRLLRETAAGLEPAQVEFSSDGWFVGGEDGRHTCLMPCITTPDLQSLHDTFDGVIRPRSRNAYPDGYFAHMALCQDCRREQIQRAETLVAGLDIGAGFRCTSVQLVGRVGTSLGGDWRLIDSFTLSSA